MSTKRQDRTIKWGEWNELNKAFGFKPTKPTKSNDERKAAQRQKFAKCKKCGGQMTYVAGSNILVCNNITEKKHTITAEDGSKKETVVTEECGNINLVDKQYMNYVKYLFEEEN